MTNRQVPPNLKRVRLLAWLLVAIAIVGMAALAFVSHQQTRSTQAAAGPIKASFGGPFTLVDGAGKPFSSQALAGKPYAIYFGFTRCGDVCPTTLARLVRLRREAANDQAMRIVFVTIDPAHDGPKEVGQYATLFNAPIIGLTGSPAQIEQVKKQYGIFGQPSPHPMPGKEMEHTATVLLFNRNGDFAGPSRRTSRMPPRLPSCGNSSAEDLEPRLSHATWTAMTRYRPDPKILELGPEFYDPVEPARFPDCTLRFVNERWAHRVGLELNEDDRAKHFCRFEPLPDNLRQPLALRYHGHQFRVYNPDIGDGRGFTFAQLRDDRDRLLDLGTKGSGQTPYSRRADGRLTLKGGVREVLATEMVEALGVNTSKSFALFETGEPLTRGDEPSPTRSSVLTRLSHGHIRIGTFQRLAFFEQREDVTKLTSYCLEYLYGEDAAGDDGENALRLFDLASAATARLAASYIAGGFVHGVLNSDNINVTGESFDYGPWRFTPYWDREFTAAYFDHYGLYAFARQPEAIHWNLAQLAGCLSLVAEAPKLKDILEGWSDRFDEALTDALLSRLGVQRGGEDRAVAGALVRASATRTQSIDRIFFDWRGGHDPGAELYPAGEFRELAALLKDRERPRSHPYWSEPGPCSLHIDEVEAIWDSIATTDDWQPFNNKVKAIRHMGEAMLAD